MNVTGLALERKPRTERLGDGSQRLSRQRDHDVRALR